MRLILGLVLFGLGILFVVVGTCGVGIGLSAREILHASSDYSHRAFKLADRCTTGLWPRIFSDKNYLVLLQNNAELRATGGFVGSYVRLEFEKEGLVTMHVSDIYQPDGQLVGHVEPPYPIQEAFGQGWWKLRDSNWDPDFSRSAPVVRWFFEQGGEGGVDGVVAVNLDLFREWLGVFGSIKTQSYDEEISDDNLYSLAQKYAESSFQPGSTGKRDFLAVVGLTMVERTKQASFVEQMKLVRLVLKELHNKQILLWANDHELQKIILDNDLGGKLYFSGDQNYLYVVEDNLGVNKANPLISRKLIVNSNGKSEQLQIEWKNGNPFATPKPPLFWGGDYFAYIRVVVPEDFAVVDIKIADKKLDRRNAVTAAKPTSILTGRSEDLYNVETRDGLQLIGFWVHVEAGKNLSIQIDLTGSKEYKKLILKRQPGIRQMDYLITRDGKIVGSGSSDRDVYFEW